MHTPSVAVLGGGVAGLAAASALADAGVAVTLVEAAAALGGAAASIVDPRTGFEVDLALPVWSAAPDGAAAWLARLGAGSLLEPDLAPLELYLPGHAARLRASGPAGALRAAGSLLKCDLLEPVDRARAVAGALMIRLGAPAPQESHSLYRWLRQARQSPAAIGRLWNALSILATGLAVEEVAAEAALPALAHSLGAGAAGFRCAFARQGLRRLFELVAGRLRARGGAVLTGQAARRLVITGHRVHAVELADGRLLKPEACVLALPPAALGQILPDSWAHQGPFALAARARFNPRASVHLFYDRAIMAPPVAVAVDEEPLWLVQRLRSGGGAAAVSVYPAAGGAWPGLERDEAVARADAAVRAACPETRGAKLIHALTAVQPGAVLLAAPGSQTVRPGPETPVDNAWLAGAWTRTGYPGSMDGAYISGRAAAENVLKNLSTHVGASGGIGGDLSSRGNPAGPARVVSGSTVDRRPSATTSDGDGWKGLKA